MSFGVILERMIIFVGLCVLTLGFMMSIVNDKDKNKILKEYDLLIQECEKTLPRNQYCHLIAVPVEDN